MFNNDELGLENVKILDIKKVNDFLFITLDKTVKISTISKFLSDNGKQTFNIKEVLDIYEKNN